MTLVELMIVVVIIGLLAAVATFMFSKQTRKARAGEVDAVFAEMALKQEAYRARNGEYFTHDDFFPSLVPSDVAQPSSGTTAIEASLRLELKPNLYCVYVTANSLDWLEDALVTGANTIEAEFDIGSGLSIEPPFDTDWYINAAICDFDGNGVFSSVSYTHLTLPTTPYV